MVLILVLCGQRFSSAEEEVEAYKNYDLEVSQTERKNAFTGSSNRCQSV